MPCRTGSSMRILNVTSAVSSGTVIVSSCRRSAGPSKAGILRDMKVRTAAMSIAEVSTAASVSCTACNMMLLSGTAIWR